MRDQMAHVDTCLFLLLWVTTDWHLAWITDTYRTINAIHIILIAPDIILISPSPLVITVII
ncbi:hypothetical protein [Photobacterium swingsii]|uniref:hypothetical protein n=1 Tax=Photobacterium swingsii TaxID=680026 RepID=UPI000A52BAF0|nr:hypothetical protein [Photobacterium swingsii]